MEFPNLKDTKFPNVGNVNVYSYRNDFDYTRWTPSTRLKLCNVLWNGDYEDVVKFESDTARDAFFANLIESDPQNAVKYIDMLKAGGSDNSVVLLKNAGVDLNTPAPIEFALKEFDNTLTELEKLLAK